MPNKARGRLRVAAAIIPFLVAMSLAVWQLDAAGADGPQPVPNPLAVVPGGPSSFAPIPGVDIMSNGPAASIHGNPVNGQTIFASNCATCHNDRGVGNLPNPGTDDTTVPPLNPIDPGFYAGSGGDPGAFAKEIDLFIQHGSRPAGSNPTFNMIPWGDHNLLSQQQIADVEAYVMQLNGVYWPDRWNPPAEIRGTATQSGNLITYQVTIVNQGGSTLGHLDLSDKLPDGLTYVSSYLVSGQNPGRLNSNGAVEWINDDGVPDGGTFGPFVVVAQSAQSTPPVNTFQLSFNWTGPDGTLHTSSAVSNPIVPGATASRSNPAASLPSLASPTPAAASPAVTPSPSATATPAALSSGSPSATTVATVPSATAVASPSPNAVATTAPTVAPTATPAPAAPQPASIGVQIVQPSDNALSWGYQPPTISIHVGDTVIWTNQGMIQHTVTADDGSFDSGMISNGATWNMTFNTAGTYNYHCTPHPWMKGTVVVQ